MGDHGRGRGRRQRRARSSPSPGWCSRPAVAASHLPSTATTQARAALGGALRITIVRWPRCIASQPRGNVWRASPTVIVRLPRGPVATRIFTAASSARSRRTAALDMSASPTRVSVCRPARRRRIAPVTTTIATSRAGPAQRARATPTAATAHFAIPPSAAAWRASWTRSAPILVLVAIGRSATASAVPRPPGVLRARRAILLDRPASGPELSGLA